MARGLLALLFAASTVMATPAWALFDAQVLTGKRNAKFSSSGTASDTLSGTELRAAAHVDPIPLVPVGFGLALSQTSWDKDSDKLGTSSIDGQDIDLEVEAWLPIGVAGLLPYAKLSYTLAGKYTFETINTGAGTIKADYKPTGAMIHVGLKYEFLLRLGVMLEVEAGTRKLEFDKIQGVSGADAKDIDESSTSILLGVQAGL